MGGAVVSVYNDLDAVADVVQPHPGAEQRTSRPGLAADPRLGVWIGIGVGIGVHDPVQRPFRPRRCRDRLSSNRNGARRWIG